MTHEHCPVCGENHAPVFVQLDLYEVIARWMAAYSGEPLPIGVDFPAMAAALKDRLSGDPEGARLLNAAAAAAHYVGEQVFAQAELSDVAGHA